jgi:hypothetical protein
VYKNKAATGVGREISSSIQADKWIQVQISLKSSSGFGASGILDGLHIQEILNGDTVRAIYLDDIVFAAVDGGVAPSEEEFPVQPLDVPPGPPAPPQPDSIESSAATLCLSFLIVVAWFYLL